MHKLNIATVKPLRVYDSAHNKENKQGDVSRIWPFKFYSASDLMALYISLCC